MWSAECCVGGVQTVLEDKRINALGKTYNTTSAYKEGQPYIKLETNVVFGRLVIQSKRW